MFKKVIDLLPDAITALIFCVVLLLLFVSALVIFDGLENAKVVEKPEPVEDPSPSIIIEGDITSNSEIRVYTKYAEPDECVVMNKTIGSMSDDDLMFLLTVSNSNNISLGEVIRRFRKRGWCYEGPTESD